MAKKLNEKADELVKKSYQKTKDNGFEYFTPDHIFETFLEDISHMVYLQKSLQQFGIEASDFHAQLHDYLDQNIPRVPLTDEVLDPKQTTVLKEVITYAARLADQLQRDEISPQEIIAGMLKKENTFVAMYLKAQEINLDKFIEVLMSTDNPEEENTALTKYAVNLNERAKNGKIDPVIGREEIVNQVVTVLSQRRKSNPLVVGEAGVGKTAIADALALKIVANQVPDAIKDAVIYTLDMASLLAGAKFRGEFEERLKQVLKVVKENPNIILFIDEIHTLVGAGSGNSAMDASNLLKPALSSGEARVIGATTWKEYRQIFEKDDALSRRFQKVDVSEPTLEDTIEILKGIQSRFEQFHGVRYTEEAIKLSPQLTNKHLTNRRNPDKSIDVIDMAGAIAKNAKKNSTDIPTIDVAEIAHVVSKIAKIPLGTVNTSDKEKLRNLDEKLKGKVFGQDAAVDQVVKAIKISRSGLGSKNKPIGSFMFAGPTGTGKTELALQLANNLGVPLVRIDMSEYMERHAVAKLIGSPPGYIGSEKGGLLTELISQNPHCVLLLDEIEKAHPDIYNILLQIMDYGTLTDNDGRKSDFKNVVLIMTTNAGAQVMNKRTIGFGGQEEQDKAQQANREQALSQVFSPEFRGRLSGVVQFTQHNEQTIARVVDKQLAILSEKLTEQNIEISYSDELKKYIAEKGFNVKLGARPLENFIEENLVRNLADEVLFGDLEKGGIVKIDLDSNQQIKINVLTSYKNALEEVQETITQKKPRKKKASVSSETQV